MLNGGCNGISVIFAELYGQRKWEKLRKESFLSLLIGFLAAVILSFVGVVFLHIILNAIKTPENVYPYARDYFDRNADYIFL